MSNHDDTGPTEETEPRLTERALTAYNSTSEWIRFADAKAAVVLTFHLAMAASLISTLGEFMDTQEPQGRIPWPFYAWAVLGATSSGFSIVCILPFRQGRHHPKLDSSSHFHPAAISKTYKHGDLASFQSDFNALDDRDYRREILASLLIDSHISARKYKLVSASLLGLVGASIFAAMFYWHVKI